MGQDLGIGMFVDMMGARFELVARMGDTVLFRTGMAPGKLVPLHSHGDPECFYVLAGRLEVFLAGDAPGWRGVEAGGSILIADGIKHAVRNGGDTSVDLVLATNDRFARFLSEAGRVVTPDAPFAPPSPEAIQQVLRAAEAYGYWMASPAESAAVIG